MALLKSRGREGVTAKLVRLALTQVKARRADAEVPAASHSMQDMLDAISDGDVQEVQRQALNCPDPNLKTMYTGLMDPVITWPLHLAISLRNEQLTSLLLSAGCQSVSGARVDPNLQDVDGFTVMIIAAAVILV